MEGKDKCGCETACPPCMGRCGCFYQKHEVAFISTGILISIVLTMVIVYLAMRNKVAKAISRIAR